jgi:hypothetical protein
MPGAPGEIPAGGAQPAELRISCVRLGTGLFSTCSAPDTLRRRRGRFARCARRHRRVRRYHSANRNRLRPLHPPSSRCVFVAMVESPSLPPSSCSLVRAVAVFGGSQSRRRRHNDSVSGRRAIRRPPDEELEPEAGVVRAERGGALEVEQVRVQLTLPDRLTVPGSGNGSRPRGRWQASPRRELGVSTTRCAPGRVVTSPVVTHSCSLRNSSGALADGCASATPWPAQASSRPPPDTCAW